MELGVLLHHRGFLRGAGFQKRGLTRYLRLTKRRFLGAPLARHFQPVFQPVTEPVRQRARLHIFTLFDFLRAYSAGIGERNFTRRNQSRFRPGRGRDSGQLQGGFFRGLRRDRGPFTGVREKTSGVRQLRGPAGDIGPDRKIDELPLGVI
ncbi:hypothetical protein ACPF8X_01780 [Streptomyces sp. G35A]